ncbi:MAG: hypothetical protein J6332_01195, partial [Abditibacteriota bacterium]|nr:hypothetical protein [Abditibacteriota bacterium]
MLNEVLKQIRVGLDVIGSNALIGAAAKFRLVDMGNSIEKMGIGRLKSIQVLFHFREHYESRADAVAL